MKPKRIQKKPLNLSIKNAEKNSHGLNFNIRIVDVFNSTYSMRLENLICRIVDWRRGKQLKKKILAYKAKL